MPPHRRTTAAALTTLLFAASPAVAQPPAPPPSSAKATDAPTAIDEARSHFQRGLLLFDEEAWDAAFAEFVRSRALHVTRAATKNAAFCARKLKRFDEALDLFEELLRIPDLPADDKSMATQEVKALRGLVGSIDVKDAEPGATIVVDGRNRGAAPVAAIRVSVGTHVVRVYKGGFEAFETRVDVASGQSMSVEARLAPLAQAGRMKITEQDGKVLDVVIDNVVVGKTPWDGALPPGDHTVLLRGEGDLGTQPTSAPVRLNQVTPLTLYAEPLSARLRVQPTPAGATVAVDGVSVGRGLWDGRLRGGPHRVEVAADGFLPDSRNVDLDAGKPAVVDVQLERDPSSALWNENRGRFSFEVDGAFALTPSLGGDIAGGCTTPCTTSPGIGFMILGRGGYRFPSGFMVGIDAGFLQLTQTTAGRATTLKPAGSTADPGAAADTLTLRGLLVGASAGVRIGSRFPLTLRLGAGALLGSLRDHRTGTFRAIDHTPVLPYSVDVAESPSVASVYVAPEARFGVVLAKRLELSFGVQALVLVAVSPPTWVPGDQPVLAGADGQGEFATKDALAGKAMVVILPGLGARYEF